MKETLNLWQNASCRQCFFCLAVSKNVIIITPLVLYMTFSWRVVILLPLLIFAVQTTIRGVFKKRPNFLNGSPTSKESALRHMSAPRVKVCQQIAICPVSLWALVVALHPLNWAHAQAVRRISDKVTMKVLEEKRVCMFEILLQTW